MKHLLSLVFCLLTATIPCAAQSAITVSLDGGNIIFVGAQVKYTYSFKKVQLGAFVIPTIYNDYRWEYLTRGGLCVNSVPKRKRDANFYYGMAVEGYTEHGLDKAVMVGPHLGVNVKLSKQLYLNSEWGARIGLLFTETYEQSPGAYSHGWPGTYRETTEKFFYFPASIGLTYVFGRKRDKEE